jgi:WD40 repeat protein
MLSASHDGAIRMWDAATGGGVAAFDWTIGPVTAVAFAPDGLTAAAAGEKGQVVTWDTDV